MAMKQTALTLAASLIAVGVLSTGNASATVIDLGTLGLGSSLNVDFNIPGPSSFTDLWAFEVSAPPAGKTVFVDAQLTDITSGNGVINSLGMNLDQGTLNRTGSSSPPAGQIVFSLGGPFTYYSTGSAASAPTLLAISGVAGPGSPTNLIPTQSPLATGLQYYIDVSGLVPAGATGSYNLAVNLVDKDNGRQGGVPEISTWAMMVLGFGLTALQLRRRSTRRSLASIA